MGEPLTLSDRPARSMRVPLLPLDDALSQPGRIPLLLRVLLPLARRRRVRRLLRLRRARVHLGWGVHLRAERVPLRHLAERGDLRRKAPRRRQVRDRIAGRVRQVRKQTARREGDGVAATDREADVARARGRADGAGPRADHRASLLQLPHGAELLLVRLRLGLRRPVRAGRVVLVPALVPCRGPKESTVPQDGRDDRVVEQGLVVRVCVVGRARKVNHAPHRLRIVLEELHPPRDLVEQVSRLDRAGPRVDEARVRDRRVLAHHHERRAHRAQRRERVVAPDGVGVRLDHREAASDQPREVGLFDIVKLEAPVPKLVVGDRVGRLLAEHARRPDAPATCKGAARVVRVREDESVLPEADRPQHRERILGHEHRRVVRSGCEKDQLALRPRARHLSHAGHGRGGAHESVRRLNVAELRRPVERPARARHRDC
mmetsp:Transcript_37611/g.121881  ORF Transcript_37611/g.121881 Transcript_37611/m.121881 type:complete len:432 (-) Transcript_37611:71-1366(-)